MHGHIKNVLHPRATTARSNRGFHDAVRTTTKHDCCPLLGFHFVQHGMEKNNKTHCYFGFTSKQDSTFPPSVCATILVTQFDIMIQTK